MGARSLAFPAISACIFGYPSDEATRVIAAAIRTWADAKPTVFDEIRLVGFDSAITDLFQAGLDATA
ncbi:MAG: hypothetical protein HKN01_00915 [Acidimicrobiia bacterium]|nr:hypothetical protein [Acidimicrobiia bacterium]